MSININVVTLILLRSRPEQKLVLKLELSDERWYVDCLKIKISQLLWEEFEPKCMIYAAFKAHTSNTANVIAPYFSI